MGNSPFNDADLHSREITSIFPFTIPTGGRPWVVRLDSRTKQSEKNQQIHYSNKTPMVKHR